MMSTSISRVEWRMSDLVKALNMAKGDGAYTLVSYISGPEPYYSEIPKLLEIAKSRLASLSPDDDELISAKYDEWSPTRDSNVELVKRRHEEYEQYPKNGLAIYCGTLGMVDGQPKTLIVDVEPIKQFDFEPCFAFVGSDLKFNTDHLEKILENGHDGPVYIDEEASALLKELLKTAGQQ